MSHSSVLRLIDKVGEEHDSLVKKWRDELVSELEIPQTEPVNSHYNYMGVDSTNNIISCTKLTQYRLSNNYISLMFHQRVKKAIPIPPSSTSQHNVIALIVTTTAS